MAKLDDIIAKERQIRYRCIMLQIYPPDRLLTPQIRIAYYCLKTPDYKAFPQKENFNLATIQMMTRTWS